MAYAAAAALRWAVAADLALVVGVGLVFLAPCLGDLYFNSDDFFRRGPRVMAGAGVWRDFVTAMQLCIDAWARLVPAKMFLQSVYRNVFGDEAAWYHWADWVVHVLNSVLVYAFSMRVLGMRSLGLLAALALLLWPTRGMTIYWWDCSGCMTQGVTWLLMSLWLYAGLLRGARRGDGLRIRAMLACLALAGLTYEHMLPAAGLFVPLAVALRGRRSRRFRAATAAAALCVPAVIVGVRQLGLAPPQAPSYALRTTPGELARGFAEAGAQVGQYTWGNHASRLYSWAFAHWRRDGSLLKQPGFLTAWLVLSAAAWRVVSAHARLPRSARGALGLAAMTGFGVAWCVLCFLVLALTTASIDWRHLYFGHSGLALGAAALAVLVLHALPLRFAVVRAASAAALGGGLVMGFIANDAAAADFRAAARVTRPLLDVLNADFAQPNESDARLVVLGAPNWINDVATFGDDERLTAAVRTHRRSFDLSAYLTLAAMDEGFYVGPYVPRAEDGGVCLNLAGTNPAALRKASGPFPYGLLRLYLFDGARYVPADVLQYQSGDGEWREVELARQSPRPRDEAPRVVSLPRFALSSPAAAGGSAASGGIAVRFGAIELRGVRVRRVAELKEAVEFQYELVRLSPDVKAVALQLDVIGPLGEQVVQHYVKVGTPGSGVEDPWSGGDRLCLTDVHVPWRGSQASPRLTSGRYRGRLTISRIDGERVEPLAWTSADGAAPGGGYDFPLEVP